MSFVNKLRQLLRITIYSPWSLYFNFRYFPLKIAMKLPVFLYKPQISGKGKYIIEGPVRTGMIKFGFPMVSIYRERGAVLENKGTIIFKGVTSMGGGSAISVGPQGKLIFGDRFANQSGGKIVCYHQIEFGHTVRLGWQCLVCDTDFHTLKTEDGKEYTKGYGPIKIGDEVWVGSYSLIYKNTEVPSRCTIASRTLLNKKIDCSSYSLIYSGGGIKTKYTGMYRDIDDDKINYSSSIGTDGPGARY